MSSKLRIAIIAACPFPLPRGTPVRIVRMAEALAARGHDVHVMTYHLGSGDVPAGVHVHRIRNLRFYQKLQPGPSPVKLAVVDPVLTALTRRKLRAGEFDVIHAHHYEGLLVGALARISRRIPLVYDAHTLLSSELPFYPLGMPASVKKSVGAWMDGWMPKLADHTVCVTEIIRKKLIQNGDLAANRISVVSNGVEVDHFDPASQPKTRPKAGNTVIFTGNLAEYQGIDFLLKAFREVAARIPQARLLIATDSSFGPYEPLARELGIRSQIELIMSPRFQDLPRLLADSDVAVNPRNDGDGIPVKLLNYMAAGRPVVSFASSAPGVVHGVTGWLAENGNAISLGDGIIKLLQHPELADSLGRAARKYVVEHCSWNGVAERCEGIYHDLIEAGKGQ